VDVAAALIADAEAAVLVEPAIVRSTIQRLGVPSPAPCARFGHASLALRSASPLASLALLLEIGYLRRSQSRVDGEIRDELAIVAPTSDPLRPRTDGPVG
jgi:hypothetical protein